MPFRERFRVVICTKTAALVVLLGLLAGCSTAAPSPPSAATAPGAPSPTAASSASPGPASSSPAVVTPTPLSPEAQMETDRLLILAAKANDPARVRELIAAGGNVNAKDAIQDSAFLYAGAEGFNEVLQLTLDAGADVRSINRYGGTALIPASEHGHTDTVRILIAAGVPVNHVNNLGWTAMQEAILLNNGGPNQQDVVRQLLAAGADPDIRDPEGRTALQNAERLGFREIAALIRNR
ncbi:ankyrin repeat domain-containing protein [Paenarthrobacter sp. JL.01a]|uniref:ankyrin repeat domain-containing protein n=1 Tax=Paenarthrobacter sp. JL.01a TaxID=2979324 RepID=UPI0021C56D90|nr:ankyrin repeat domain-containing protein [Paenarthrobacter sp. JL.01a]UXM92145.1 ankyrin repeat domain-containing protein [Paenarthrobacter sp. JL.01a]